MKIEDYSDPNLLKNIIENLYPADIPDKEKFSPAEKIKIFFGRITTVIRRIAYCFFKDRRWHNESEARQVLKEYTVSKECREKLKDQKEKIRLIYDRLVHLKKGYGTWADGISKEFLFAEEDVLEEELQLPKINKLLDKEVFFPESPEEKLFQKEKKQKVERVLDPKGQTHRFVRQKLASPDQRLLFHIQADEFGSSSQLEGGKGATSVRYLSSFLKSVKVGHEPKPLIQELENTVHLHGFSDEIAVEKAQKQIGKGLEENKPILLEGGWTGQPSGHAIYYEIIPTSKNKASFRLYNTGAGISSHASGVKGGKVKYQAYEEWQEIDREAVTSPLFLQSVYEMQTHLTFPGKSTKTEYGERDIYGALKALLNPKKVETSPSLKNLMTPQRSGVCAWKSLMAWLRTKVDIGDYKRFKADLKLQSLLDFVEDHSYQPSLTEWRMVKKSHEHLCRSIAKLHREKLVGDAYIESAEESLERIAKWIKTHASRRHEKAWVTIPQNYYLRHPDYGYVLNPHAFEQPLHKIQNLSEKSSIQPFQVQLDSFQQIDLSQSKKVGASISTLLDTAKRAWKTQNDATLNKGLLDAVTELSIDETFWKEAVKGKRQLADTLVMQLQEMSELFLKSSYYTPDSDIIFSEKIYFFYKVLHLQKVLCQIAHPKWKDFKLLDRSFGKKHLFFNLVHPKMREEFEKITSLHVDYGVLLDGYNDEKGAFQDFDQKITFVKQEVAHNFQDLLRKEYPKVVKEIAKEEKGFHSMPKFSQDAHLFASSKLPGWIRAMRDTQLASKLVINSKVAPLKSFNRTDDLSIHFQVEDGKEKSRVTISFQGVDKNNIEKKKFDRLLNNNSYVNQFNKINNRVVKEFLLYKMDYTPSTEEFYANYRVIKKPTDVPLKDEEFKELLRIFVDSDIRVIEVLDFFTRNPSKLKDTDYQTLLQALLFQDHYLEISLKSKGFDKLLALFIQQNYENLVEQNAIQPAVFFLRLSHQLEQLCQKGDFYAQSLENLKKLLNRKGIKEEEKIVIYSEIIAELGHKKSLDEEEIVLLLAGSLFVEENQQGQQNALNPIIQKEMREALLVHSNQLKRVLLEGNPNQKVLNQILKILHPGIKEAVHWTSKTEVGEFPSFVSEDKAHALYPLLPRLVSLNAEVPLPLNIRQNPNFQKLFPTVEKGQFLPGNVFSFGDEKGVETLVSFNEGNLVIEQKQKGEWLRYIPSNVFLEVEYGEKKVRSSFFSRYLAEEYDHWQTIEEGAKEATLYLVDPRSGERKYICRGDIFGNNSISIKEVKHVEQDLFLGNTVNLFHSIEDPAYIHGWFTSKGELKRVELPRFGLSFRINPPGSNNLICEQFPDYRVNLNKSIKEMGAHHNYVVFEDANGGQKLLLSRQSLRAPEEKEVLLPRYELDRKLGLGESCPQKYVLFDVQKNGKLFHHSREANLYLAQVLTTAQEYKRAAYYLKKVGKKLSAYTPEEDKILKGLSSVKDVTGDQSGNGTALQLYAGTLRLKNRTSHHRELSKSDLEEIATLYRSYLNRYNNITVFQLRPEEEILLLKTFLGQGFDVVFYLRLKELDPLAAQKINIPQVERKEKGKSPLNLSFHYNLDLDKQEKNGSAEKTLITRPEQLKEITIHHYQIARKGSAKEKQRLRACLPFLRVLNQGKYASQADFFELVLDHPEAFPDPLRKSDYEDNDIKWYPAIREWKENLKSIAEKLLEGKPSKQEAKIRSPEILPKEEEEKPEALPPIRISLQLPQVKTLASESKPFFQVVPTKKTGDLGGLKSVLNSCRSDQPVQNQEVDRLEKDIGAYQQAPPPPSYTIDEKGFGKVKELLLKDREKDRKTIKQLEEQILSLANKKPSKKELASIMRLKKWGKQSKVITLEELIVAFARNDFRPFLDRNPALVEEDLNALAENVGLFLLYATRDQQRCRAEESIRKIETCKKPEEREDLINQLAERLLAEREYPPNQHPAYLAFEYFADLLMRPSQVQKLGKFLSGEEPDVVMEMIMGSGKSKVLLPLLGLLRADGETLSMLIVPQPLFESVSQDTQAILQAFSQDLHALHFDRQTKFTKERLEQILDELESVQKNRQCLMMTSKSMQCLLLKFIEESYAHFSESKEVRERSEELKLMQKILTLLGKHGYPILDEADTVLNILREVSFSRGKKVPPPTQELELLSEIYQLVYEDPKLKAIASFESDPNPNPDAPVLTEELYRKKYQVPLANAVIDRMGTMEFSSKALTKKMHGFVANLNDDSRAKLLQFLCRDERSIQSSQKFFDSLDTDVQDMVALAGEEISHLLPYTLTRVHDVKYGLDPESEDPLAIPFSASKTPSSGSQFSNAHITMNYTFQTYMKKGITLEILEHQLEIMQNQAMRQMLTSGGTISIIETEAGKAFEKLRGKVNIPLFNYKKENVQELLDTINATPKAKLSFISNILLPQLERFEHKLSCNPINLVSFFRKAAGFTGTLWNGKSMHHRLKPEPAIGTDAKTLSILWEKSRDNTVTIQGGTVESMLNELKEKKIAFDMISDAGGYFREGTNGSMAHQIAASQGKEVVFYNEKGEQVITNGEQEIPLSQSRKAPSQRLTFLDQSHTTGADVPQALDALGLVTIGRDMLLRDLLQSVWRLRRLDKSQSVRFLVSEEVAEVIRQRLGLEPGHPIQLDSILKFVISNQSSQQGRDNYKSLKEGMANLFQKILVQVLLNDKITPKARAHAMQNLISVWIRPSIYPARELYGQLSKEVKADDVIEMDKKQCVAKIRDLFGKMRWLEKLGITEKECLQEIDGLVKRIENATATKLKVPSLEIEDDQTVEVERETKTETERETELEVKEAVQEESVRIGKYNSHATKYFHTFQEAIRFGKSDVLPIFPLRSFLKSDPDLEIYSDAFDGIDIAMNGLEFSNFVPRESKLLGSHRVDFHHLLVDENRVTMLSQEEAKLFFNHPRYYNLTLGFNDPNKKPTREQRMQIVKVKFLNGESQYSLEELELLKLWFKTLKGKKIHKFFLEQVLKGFPIKIARYQNSPLQQLFATI